MNKLEGFKRWDNNLEIGYSAYSWGLPLYFEVHTHTMVIQILCVYFFIPRYKS